MASTSLLHLLPSLNSRRLASDYAPSSTTFASPHFSAIRRRRSSNLSLSISASSALQSLIFDCDGVILESEHLHRQAYNDAFLHFNVRSPSSATEPLTWGSDFYDELQNRIGGGKPKMRWFFKEKGWPSSSIFRTPPEDDTDRAMLIDSLQDWKTERYKEIIKSGTVEPRPGVLRLMDEAKAAGIKLAVCSAATKSSVILCLENLIGIERFQGLDCFLAGRLPTKLPKPDILASTVVALGSNADCHICQDSQYIS
ncbi:hypothetical protein HHK36_003989 [Tetracentron sinense]|uniref:Uncharacterized protein n=1 Tax=Tetracentron sinense TaxID=13715 RepID=A0A834ZQ23_TETSI|nr:hypothetical protein HHK36_003989 [Tetracentron sinense]